MASYSALQTLDGVARVDMVRRDDATLVLTGRAAFGDEVVDLPDFDDKDGIAYRAWLAAGGVLGEPVPTPRVREAYGDDLITALSDAELTALSGGTPRDQRMLSAQRVPFRASDDIIVRLAAVMKIEPAAWLARVPAS